jgi:tetratricopeptide (TPR) repeat protein
MGGVGKTQVAVEYVYRFRSNYENIFWIPSADQLSVLNGFQRVAQTIGIGGSTGEVVSEVMELVFAWLKSKQRWLLVFDGLDEISVVNGLLPDNGPDRHTLITTRNPRVWSLPAVGLEVPPLQLGESIDLFYTLSQVPISLEPVEQSALHEIVTQLGHLPLAIAQAASYIRETSVSIAAFRDAYNKIEEPRRASRGDYRYKQTISKTFSLSFKMVANDYPPARELLQLLSFLNPDGVLVDFLTIGAPTLKSHPSLYQAMADRSQVVRAISVLERFSLVKFDNPNQTIYIHRLVQATLRDQMSLSERQDSLSTVIALCDFSFPRDINDKSITQCRRFLGQVVEPLLALRTIETLECAMLKERVARFLTSEGKYQESAAMLLQAIETREVVSGNEHPDTINDLSSLADVYIYQGRLDDAASLEERILRMRENLLGNDHPDTITTLSNLAAVYSQQQGRLDEALQIDQQVLEKRMALLGPRHVDTMNTLSRLARTYSQQGRYEEARRLAEGVLESRRTVLGEENPETLIAMNDLALICRRMGDYDEAERHMKQALAVSFRVLGPDHSDSIMAMGNLALIYGEEGKATEARELEEKVLAYNLKFRGPEHSHTLTAMTNLAETCYSQGDFPAAIRLWEQSVTAREKADGEDSPATLATILRLGEAYRKLRRFDEAISLLERVLSKRVMLFGREHPETLNAMLLLAVTYLDIGRGIEASAMLERVFEGTERVLGTNHPTTTTAMYYLSVAYKAVGKYQEAARLDKMLESAAPGLKKLMDARP